MRVHRLGLASALLAATLVGCSSGDKPDATLQAFLDGWRSGKLDAVGFVATDGHGISAQSVTDEIKALSGDLAKNPPTLRVSQKPKVNKDVADAEINVSWPIAQDVTWDYGVPVKLTKENDKWRMVWSAAVVQPRLTSGDKLTLRRTAAGRGAILDSSGKPIVEPRRVVDIGVEKQKIKDLPSLTRELDRAFKSINEPVDLGDLPQRVANATPDAFIPLITLRWEVYERIRFIRDLDGTVFIDYQRPLAPTREFARALLGTVGEVTKEIMDANPNKYQVGDVVGLSGLQRQYDDRLRGTPGATVLLTRKDAEGKANETQLWQSPPKPGAPVKLSLNTDVQRAADNALKSQAKKTALVAVRVSTGEVLAVANGPGGGDVNLALTAQVPPGSTFKMVSALALLDAGTVTPTTAVQCPKTYTVDGQPFKNSENFELGNVPFRTDFAKSCNTAFARLGEGMPDNALADAGRTVGLGVPWTLGVDAFSGKVSTGGSATERAAAAFGQGTTQVSPIALAAATAAVARGRWEQPKLLLDPAPQSTAPAGGELKQTTVDALRAMMREVVTAGTGTALADVPGQPVHGKTGTAEFITGDPNSTHAWFIGWQGDIALSVFVENGGGGSAVAVPLAEAFLRALPRS
jgi:cell division protein FtsI/penicillin-binding protein 2